MMMHPSAPLAAIRAKLPTDARVRYDQGYSPAGAAAIAKDADVVIVFATQWMTEGLDAPDLFLPQGQDATIAAVANANPKTIVVLETGGPVALPWLDKVGAVLEAWYPGSAGGEAIADVLFGDAEPTGRLPLTFPASLDQLPRPALDDTADAAREAGSQSHALKGFDVNYDIEGADVGYRWFDRRKLTPLFPFGFGLGYGQFHYSDLRISGGAALKVSFTVSNTGQRKARDVPQVYVTRRGNQTGQRLVGWSNIELAPGESRLVEVTADPRVLADWSDKARAWVVPAGSYSVSVGKSSAESSLAGTAKLGSRTIR